MKRGISVSAIALMVSMFLFSSGEAFAHEKTGMMGQGSGSMMGGGMAGRQGMMGQGGMMQGMMGQGKMGHSRGGLKRILHQWVRLLFSEKDQLGLSDEQLDEIQSLINAHLKTAIRKNAERKVMDIELRELLARDEVDAAEVEKKIRAAADLKAEMDIDGFRTMEKVANVLSEEQRKKMKSLFRPLVLPMMRGAGPCTMMGGGPGMMGSGKGGVMGQGGMMQGKMGQGGMMQGMMGGGMMQGRASETKGTPSSLTKSDSQGPVTVEVTFDPQGQATSGELVFEVKMNTHSVELGDIDLGKLSLLRNEEGVEVSPSKWLTTGGGGHHVKGTLVFPSVDPSGKPVLGSGTGYLELVVKNVGGTAERIFRWDLKG